MSALNIPIELRKRFETLATLRPIHVALIDDAIEAAAQNFVDDGASWRWPGLDTSGWTHENIGEWLTECLWAHIANEAEIHEVDMEDIAADLVVHRLIEHRAWRFRSLIEYVYIVGINPEHREHGTVHRLKNYRHVALGCGQWPQFTDSLFDGVLYAVCHKKAYEPHETRQIVREFDGYTVRAILPGEYWSPADCDGWLHQGRGITLQITDEHGAVYVNWDDAAVASMTAYGLRYDDGDRRLTMRPHTTQAIMRWIVDLMAVYQDDAEIRYGETRDDSAWALGFDEATHMSRAIGVLSSGMAMVRS